MSNTGKDSCDMSDLDSSLPAAAAALSAEDRAGLVNALKNKLQNLAGQHTDVMDTLSPKVRERVEALRKIQDQHDELEAKFREERAALEAKYQKLYEPFYNERFEIVNGVVEVDGVTDTLVGQGEDKANGGKGVPDFWLTAMKTNDILAEEISERDEEALKYLKDIKWSKVDDPKGLKLDFFFDTNPFFKNPVLTKTYHMVDDEEPILEKAIGTQIEWYPGRKLFDQMTKLDEVSWNSMLMGYATNGYGYEAVVLFREMRHQGVRPNEVTFTAVLSACDHCGLVEEGKNWFYVMKHDYCIEPGTEHYSCMIDLLARAGHIQEAIDLIDGVSNYRCDASMWSAILRGCIENGDKSLSMQVAERIMELDPDNSGALVQLAGVMASTGDWKQSALVRQFMREMGIQKNAGRSWL